MKYARKLTAAIFLFTFISCCAYAPAQTSPPPAQTQAQPKQAPPSARSIERAIEDAYRQQPQMHYSRVSVHVTSKEVWLRGVVLTDEAEKLAVQIARDHAAGRKIVDRLKVNPNTHPGAGI